jgi:hypothetical protein
MAVKELLTSLLIGLLASPPELSCVSTATRSAQCWNSVVSSYLWLVWLLDKSLSPLAIQDPIEKGVFLLSIVAIFPERKRIRLSFRLSVSFSPSGPVLLIHKFAIFFVVQVLLYMFRSPFSPGLDTILGRALQLPLAIL